MENELRKWIASHKAKLVRLNGFERHGKYLMLLYLEDFLDGK